MLDRPGNDPTHTPITMPRRYPSHPKPSQTDIQSILKNIQKTPRSIPQTPENQHKRVHILWWPYVHISLRIRTKAPSSLRHRVLHTCLPNCALTGEASLRVWRRQPWRHRELFDDRRCLPDMPPSWPMTAAATQQCAPNIATRAGFMNYVSPSHSHHICKVCMAKLIVSGCVMCTFRLCSWQSQHQVGKKHWF